MKLLIQPEDGIRPLLKAIDKAKKTVEIVIFRFSRQEVQQALIEAVQRGVAVRALIAFTNRGGEKQLRQLEADFLAKGITVARTAGDLVRYHGKLMLIDRKELYLLGFNFTHVDIEHSRSFGLITRNPKLLRQAADLFEADSTRQDYRPDYANFVISPENARGVLARFIHKCKRELLIYDPHISDRAMIRLLRERQKAGVKLRILGKVSGNRLPVRELKGLRLHARVMIRDKREAFLGSQSLRQTELDERREIGVIFRDGAAVKTLTRIFRNDWAASKPAQETDEQSVPVAKVAKRIRKVFRKELPTKPLVARLVKELQKSNGKLSPKKVKRTVEDAVQSSMERAAKQAAKKAAEETLQGIA